MLAITGRLDRSLTVLWEGGHIKHFSKNTLNKLMTNAGFDSLGFVGCGLWVVVKVSGATPLIFGMAC